MHIILNPTSRHGAGRRLRPIIERELERRRIDYTITETTGPGHAVELARQAAIDGATRVIAAGGDGTIHEVTNGLMSVPDTPAAMGLIPIGTGNDFVKMVPGTATRADAFATLASPCEAPVDVGVVQWDGRKEYFINAVGCGIDVEVVRQMRRSGRLPGTLVYLEALARALSRYRPIPLRIDVDGTETDARIMILAVCNGPSIGGSFRICPTARPDDGVLDVCVVHELPFHRIVRVVPRILKGTHTGQPGVSMHRGIRIRLRSPDTGPLPFQVDGELRESSSDAGFEVSIAQQRLNVLCGSIPAASPAG